jgi:hypothetical protein
MFISPSEYKASKKFAYPDPKVDQQDKLSNGWFYQFANAFWAEYVNNRLDDPYEFNDEVNYDELRAYAESKQSMEKLKDILVPKNREGKRTTKMNISWRSMDFMAKQFDIMRSMNQEVDFDVDVTCMDTSAIEEREYERSYLKFLLEKDTRAWIDKALYKPKTKIDPEAMGLQNAAQVDLFFDAGGFPLHKEIAIQAAIEKSLDLSSFPVIKDMVFDDLIVLGRMGLKTEINTATNETYPRYVDRKYTLVPYSKYLDYRNINRAAELRFMTIAEIKEEMPDIPDARLMQIARDYAYMNPDYANLIGTQGYFNLEFRKSYLNEYSVDPMLNCTVMVLDGQFLSPDTETYVNTQRVDTGNDVVYQVDNKFNPENWTNRKLAKPSVKRTRCFRKYQFKWIVGTEVFLSKGLAKDVIYDGPDGNLKPKLDYRFYKTGNKSIIQRCIGHIDDMNLANLKKRNALKTLPPAPRMIINELLLSNVMLNGILQQPEDLIRTLEEKGFLVVKTVDDFQRSNQSGKMVDFIPSGIVEDLTLFQNEIEAQKNNIREVTGVNQISDASTPDPEQGLGKSKLAISATNHALYPTFKGFKTTFEAICTDLGEKWQMIAKKGKKTIQHKPFGESIMRSLELGGDIALSKFSYKVSLKASDEDKRELLGELAGLKQQRRTNGGFGGITGSQYIFLHSRVMAGQVKLAMYMLAQMEAQQQAQDDASKQRAQQIASDNALKQSAQNSQNKIAELSALEKEKRNTTVVLEAIQRKTKIIDSVLRNQSAEGATQVFSEEDIRNFIAESDALLQMAMPTEVEKQEAAQQQAQQEQAMAEQQEGGEEQMPEEAMQEAPAM